MEFSFVAKIIMNELESLVEDVKLAIEAASETLQEGIPALEATYSEVDSCLFLLFHHSFHLGLLFNSQVFMLIVKSLKAVLFN